jgi:7tm Chemosensory receptor
MNPKGKTLVYYQHFSLQTYYQYSHVMYAFICKTTLSLKILTEGVTIIPFFLLTVILHVIACEKCAEESRRTVRLVENVPTWRTNSDFQNTVEPFLASKSLERPYIMVYNLFPVTYGTIFGVGMVIFPKFQNSNTTGLFQFCLSILSTVIVLVQFDMTDPEVMVQQH